uniref:Spindle pole body component n=1 Tax=Haptolina ericina TaxID=156174 RepID=A0A7S3AJV7_9EUKA
MAFLVDNLQYYLHVDVLEVQWQAFMEVAHAAADFETLNAAHERCLQALHSQCFLPPGSVSTALHQILQVCLELCYMLTEARFDEQFTAVSREFTRQSTYLFAYLSSMTSPQVSPHLGQLLLRLNFNQFFVQGL